MSTDLLEKVLLLAKLQPETKPLWGIMSAQHMVEHLILAVKMSNGKIQTECFNPPEKLLALKRYLMSSRPLPKEFVNPLIGAGLKPLQYSSLSEAIAVLKIEIEGYYSYFEKNPDATLVNATFGELNKIEWDVFHEKHFKHHYTQFGIE